MLINAIHLRNIGIILGVLPYGNSYTQKKIEVLNFATFQMNYTPDAHKVDFDEKDNLNQIAVTEQDRILIISGVAHAAFLHEFIKRSPKYQRKEAAEYLN
ncbi:DUF5694 domain-containing protein [Sphingobacterium sp.]|uniref:DUF5694 domain-containing protein n=1 Tax=Sphingobacterium sp. TaxID=341027 RepID=UPI0028980734|nr:DUF5694 domain-containing protein [Sphingobacterium sp.]